MNNRLGRRSLIGQSAGVAVVSQLKAFADDASKPVAYTFDGPDSFVHPKGWESLNPGYWKVEAGKLRRRIKNVGDRARNIGFPFHNSTHTNKGEYKTEYDASLPVGVLYRRDWKLSKKYEIKASFIYKADRLETDVEGEKSWKMFNPGWGLMGVAIGSKAIFNSYKRTGDTTLITWSDDQNLSLSPGKYQAYLRKRFGGANKYVKVQKTQTPKLNPGDRIELKVSVQTEGNESDIKIHLKRGKDVAEINHKLPSYCVDGYVGLVGRGLIDFEVESFVVTPYQNKVMKVNDIDCYSCYPLGDTLKEVKGKFKVKFIGLFQNDGEKAEIKISNQENPNGGWSNVPVAGSAKIIDHEWRRNTAVIEATLPFNPSETNMYYTIWKDGVNVTSDSRIDTDIVGEGTGLVGDVPSSGGYVGRLPQLIAPYKLCGLSCHAISGGLQKTNDDGHYYHDKNMEWHYRDQPSYGSYKYLEDYNFQIMVWEDDVWYMELLLYPPSTDDAYKVVKNSICGPTSRWQMMRHWNIINPGDHDYGMDDIKGPEQLILRKTKGLGQDTEYLKRNYQIVHHLVTGEEEVDPLINPKKWRAWRMPKGDFSLYILDSRLWRSSQDVDVWDDQGWGAFKSLYDRTDPTRSLLGEEQFAWLHNQLQKDASPLICLTGINGMHTVWTPTDQRNRVMADYAGWVKAGADRVLEMLGSRKGVVTVYGDVHNGSIMTNKQQGVIECSFGPIGRMGGRGVIPGFGPNMKDHDGRELEMHALYHKDYKDAKLQAHEKGAPFYYNFLEMEFNPSEREPKIGLRIRNMIDAPTDKVRGGGSLETDLSQTGRNNTCRLPKIKTLPNADVYFRTVEGEPIQAIQSRSDGTLPIDGLIDVLPGQTLLLTAYDGSEVKSQQITTS